MGDSAGKGDDKLPAPPEGWLPLLPGEKGIAAPAPLRTQYPNQPNIYDPSAPPPKRSLGLGVQGPEAPNLKIADKVLKGAAGKADEVHDAFYTPAASLEGVTNLGVEALGGLQTANALKRSHAKWEEHAGLVTAWLTNIATSLRAAANAYNETDHGVKDSLGPYLKQAAPTDSSDTTPRSSIFLYYPQDGKE
ncbi:hypothetical protein HUT19_00615 [Streptomyces sp. NA02950]|uniref:hypothetical protein n=1 Tax=Streptomyces sp. NA02950 TaxID=2742137 RepID=UPI001591D9A2|nr:hypothetical protein [Streptomyces sp. NA02950]QKV90470.1 hypothetical protein HUT19_00615 [Streptomyces sp. NA02950]